MTCASGEPIDVYLPVTSIDGTRLKVFVVEGADKEASLLPSIKIDSCKVAKLEEITNKVFEGILQEKSEGGFLKPKSDDKGSVKVIFVNISPILLI